MSNYITILLITIPIFLSGQENMTLEKLISIGLDNNFGLKIADENIKVAENNNSWARAGKGPVIDLNGSFSNTVIDENNPAGPVDGAYYNGSLGASVDISWALFSGGRIGVAKDQLELAVDEQQLLRSQEVHDLIRDITQGYADVLFNVEQRKLLYEVYGLSQQKLAYENVKRDFGQSNMYNIIQFEDAVVSDSINFIQQDNQVEIAKRNLYNTLDLTGDPNYVFNESLAFSKEELDVDKLKASLDEENYTLKTLYLVEQLNLLNTALERSARKPFVSLNASVGANEAAFRLFKDDPQTGEPLETEWSNQLSASLGLNLNWNIYNGGVTKQNIENARIQEEIGRLDILKVKSELYNQLDILLQNYNNQLTILDLTEIQITNSRKNLEISEERFKSGQITSLDYRTTQNQFLSAATNRVDAMYNLLITKSEIDWLVGVY